MLKSSLKRGRPVSCDELAAPVSGITDVASLVASFSEEGYAVMSLDAARNTAFAKALHYCVQHLDQHNWLDIGTGEDALLTTFILRAGMPGLKPLASISTRAECDFTNGVVTRARVCAIEGGIAAAEGAARKLAPYRRAAGRATLTDVADGSAGGGTSGDLAPFIRRSAWALVTGLSSATASERSVAAIAGAWEMPGGRFPALVHELLGFFASAEWAVQTVRASFFGITVLHALHSLHVLCSSSCVACALPFRFVTRIAHT
jgi:hypothetical protein